MFETQHRKSKCRIRISVGHSLRRRWWGYCLASMLLCGLIRDKTECEPAIQFIITERKWIMWGDGGPTYPSAHTERLRRRRSYSMYMFADPISRHGYKLEKDKPVSSHHSLISRYHLGSWVGKLQWNRGSEDTFVRVLVESPKCVNGIFPTHCHWGVDKTSNIGPCMYPTKPTEVLVSFCHTPSAKIYFYSNDIIYPLPSPPSYFQNMNRR